MSKLVAVSLVLAVAAMLLIGCSGSNDQLVYQWVMERVSWNPAGTRLAFTAEGANGNRYVYSISTGSGNLTLLTRTDNDKDLTDEGGKQPAWAPDGGDIAIVARRGGGTQSLYLMDPSAGDDERLDALTSADATVPGADAQPSWKPDSSQLVFVSTKNSPTGRWEIWVIDRDGTDLRMINRDNDATDAQWPVFSPDGTQIIYQSRLGDTAVDTSLRIVSVGGGETKAIDGTEGNNFREEQPSVVTTTTGTVVAFTSNRNGDFDIWTMNLDGSGAAAVSVDARSDGFPVWSPDASRIAFTRENEVWTMKPDGTDQDRVTKRYSD